MNAALPLSPSPTESVPPALRARPPSGCPLTDEELDAFARELETIHAEVAAKVGEEDLADLVMVDKRSKQLTLLGRTLIYVSLDPITFSAGVLSLFAGKQLNEIEVCHAILHGTYDRFDHPRLHSSRVVLDSPISERGWASTHAKHHADVNVYGRDPDARFGVLRQHEHVPHKWHHRVQLMTLASNFVGLAGQLNLMVTGVADYHMRAPEDSYVLKDRSEPAVRAAHRRAAKKAIPYYVKSLILYPALAGPFFPKVLLGNVLADTLRNIYTAATVYSGHISPDHTVFAPRTRARSTGEWYWMQIMGTSNFEVPEVLSRLSGGLDTHIEHHLFPRLPPRRLPEIAPRVRAACEKFGIPYKSRPWPATLRRMFGQFVKMSAPTETSP